MRSVNRNRKGLDDLRTLDEYLNDESHYSDWQRNRLSTADYPKLRALLLDARHHTFTNRFATASIMLDEITGVFIYTKGHDKGYKLHTTYGNTRDPEFNFRVSPYYVVLLSS